MWTEITTSDTELINKFLEVVWKADPMYKRICSFGGIIDTIERGDHHYFLWDDGESQIALGLRWKKGKNMFKLINGSILGPIDPYQAAYMHIAKCLDFLKEHGQSEAYWHRPSLSDNPITQSFHDGMASHNDVEVIEDKDGVVTLTLRVP